MPRCHQTAKVTLSHECAAYLTFSQKKRQTPKPAPDPNDPFNDDERERMQVEALAKKFENKYVSISFSHVFRSVRGIPPFQSGQSSYSTLAYSGGELN